MTALTKIRQTFFWGMAGLLGSLLMVMSGAANPFVLPCVSSNTMGTPHQNCSSSGAGSHVVPSKEKHYFHSSIRFTIRVAHPHKRSHLKKAIVDYVGRTLFPNPNLSQKALLASLTKDISRKPLSMKIRPISQGLVIATVSAKALNRIANQIASGFKNGHLRYRIAKIVYSGGSNNQKKFIQEKMPIQADEITDTQNMADTLYRISQIPGFSRVDAVFVPVVLHRDLDFPHNGVRFVIHSTKKTWTREIRKKIVLYVASRIFDMRNPAAQSIVKTVTQRTSSLFWVPMEISFGSKDTFHVWVPRRLLDRLKDALIEEAEKRGGEGTKDPLVGLDSEMKDIQNVESANHSFQEEPVFPDFIDIFNPGLSPDLENMFVHITPTGTFSGSQVEVDNYGYAPTGAVVLNASGSVNNAGLTGGLLNVMASTAGAGMTSGQISYSLPEGLQTRFGVDITAMNYSINQGFSPWGHGASASSLAALGVSGSNYSGDLWSSQGIVLRESRHLTLKELVFIKEFQDTYSQSVQNDRSLIGGTLELSGIRQFGNLSGSFDLEDTEYALSQGAGSSSQNPFYYSTEGLQNYAQGTGQISYAFTPVYSVTLGTIDQQYFGGGVLDPMLQATLGGINTVMALPTAALFGNDMYVGTLTLTRSDNTRHGLFQSSMFFDAGQIVGVGTNYSAMGPGLEEAWSFTHYFAKVDVAVPVGGLPSPALGSTITAVMGSNIGQGGIPLQLWLSAGLRY